MQANCSNVNGNTKQSYSYSYNKNSLLYMQVSSFTKF